MATRIRANQPVMDPGGHARESIHSEPGAGGRR